jgi:hypothetical protein
MAGEPVERVSREIGVPVCKRARARPRRGGAGGALQARDPRTEGPELAAALRRIGEPGMESALLRAKIGQTGPLARKRRR